MNHQPPPLDHPPQGRPIASVLHNITDFGDDNEYYGRMLGSARQILAENGLEVEPVHCRHHYQHADFLARVAEGYSGVLFTGDMYRHRDFVADVAGAFPGNKVILDHHFDDVPIHSVREDAVGGMRAIAEHLVALGHRHFAYLDQIDLEANPWKRLGVNLALRAAGLLPLGKEQIASCERSRPEDARAAFEWLLGHEPKPTAVICCDDDRALLMVEAARAMGLEVPGDLSLAGYGDTAATRRGDETLTSARIDVAGMGRRAAELLLGDPDSQPVAALVPPELVVRASTTAPRRQRRSNS